MRIRQPAQVAAAASGADNESQGLSTTPRAPFVAALTIRLAFAAGTASVTSVTFVPTVQPLSSPSGVDRITRAFRHRTAVPGDPRNASMPFASADSSFP